MKLSLNERTIKTLAAQDKDYEVFDTSVTGLLVRVQKTGLKVFYHDFRFEGGKHRDRLGKVGDITLSQARDLALINLGEVAAGKMPSRKLKKLERKAASKATEQAAQEEGNVILTLGDYVSKLYSPWVKLNRKAGDKTLELLDMYFSDFMTLPIQDVTVQRVEEWQLKQLERGLKPSSVNRPLNALRSVLSKASKTLKITNPLEGVANVPELDDDRVRFLTVEERHRLLNALHARNQGMIMKRRNGNLWSEKRGYALLREYASHQFADYLMPMVILALNTGLRRGECLQLCWRDIDLEREVLVVRAENAKSSQTRRIPLNKESKRVLSIWKETDFDPVGLVFPGSHGKAMSSIKTAWAKLMRDAAIEDLHFHDLRHDFASSLVMKGVELYTVSKLMGHASLTTTLRYAHLNDETKTEAVAQLCI